MSGKTVNDLTTLSDVPLSVLILDIENIEDYLPRTYRSPLFVGCYYRSMASPTALLINSRPHPMVQHHENFDFSNSI